MFLAGMETRVDTRGMVRRPDPIPAAHVLARVDAVADGARATDTISTGFPSVDRVLGGGPRHGDLVVLGGDVGSGKSSLALAFALRAAQAGVATSLYSSEMSVDRLLERSIAVEGRARVDDMRRGTLDEMTRVSLGVAAVRLRDGTPRFAQMPRASGERRRSATRQASHVHAASAGWPAMRATLGHRETRTAFEVRSVDARGLSAAMTIRMRELATTMNVATRRA